MSYIFIKAGESLDQAMPGPVVFLGGRTRGRDWRPEALRLLQNYRLTFISPWRANYPNPEDDIPGHSAAVLWEKAAIDRADICLFWLSDALNNQASRVEIGYALGRGKQVLVGAEPGFFGAEHLTCFAGLVLSTSLPGLLSRLENLVIKLENRLETK